MYMHIYVYIYVCFDVFFSSESCMCARALGLDQQANDIHELHRDRANSFPQVKSLKELKVNNSIYFGTSNAQLIAQISFFYFFDFNFSLSSIALLASNGRKESFEYNIIKIYFKLDDFTDSSCAFILLS